MKKIIRRAADSQVSTLDPTLHPLLERIYLARGVKSAVELERDLKSLLPFDALTDIKDAVALIAQALAQQENIVIVGDFDADGATSTALAVNALRDFGAKHIHYIVPNRFEFGYGLTPEIVAVAKQYQPNLLITVDNGIASVEGVQYAKEQGIKVVITDHHLAPTVLPDADAIVNPNMPDDEFQSKHLAGVGVIFYVMLALRRHLQSITWFEKNNIPIPNMAKLLDLVALGTIADVVPLDKNNRIMVQQGLQRIRAGKLRPGIEALLDIAKRDYQRIVASDLAFAVAPRLNAAGRLEDMSIGIECLLSEDYHEALKIANTLDNLNLERRSIEEEMQQQAFKELEKLHFHNGNLPAGLCLYDKNWHQGVVGILASRVKDKLHRPVIAFAKTNDNMIKGSARSVDGLHIRDALDLIATSHPGLISKFGGHAMAAGLSLKESNFDEFQNLFATEVSKQLSQEDFHGAIYSDGPLEEGELSLELAQLLRDAGPWGQHFPEPLFDNQFHILDQRLVGNKHLKLTISLSDAVNPIEAIAFNIDLNTWPNHRIKKMNAAYRLDVNTFRGRSNLQLVIEQIQAVT